MRAMLYWYCILSDVTLVTWLVNSVIFVLIYFLVLVLVSEIFFSFSF